MAAIALIPARGGSERVKGKNIRELAGLPLIAHTIIAATRSDCFDRILVSSDSTKTLDIAAEYGADVVRRPEDIATSTSPDIEWVKHALGTVNDNRIRTVVNGFRQYEYDTFSILRPTSPFRTPETIRRAFREWEGAHVLQNLPGGPYTSLRAVEPVSQHPGKMFYLRSKELVPMLPQPAQPMHDSQMAALPPIYVQNASLEIARTKTVEETETISGGRMLPFLTTAEEGFDINDETDWKLAEMLIESGEVKLPHDG